MENPPDIKEIIYKKCQQMSLNQDPSLQNDFIFWLNDIFDPLFKLSNQFIKILSSPSTPPSTKSKIYFLLQSTFSISPSILPQFLNNPSLVQQMITDINTASKLPLNSFDKNILYFFSYIYNSKDFYPFITEDFISSLFDCVKYIDIDDIFPKIVYILIDISSLYVSIEENKFLNVYHSHPNGRIIDEVILRLFNYENDKENILKIILLMTNIFKKEKKNVLYARDLDAVIDIVLMKLETIYAEEVKYFLLMLLEILVSFNDYYKEQYKSNIIMDLMENIKENDDNSEGLRKLSGKILRIMEKNVARVLREKAGLPPEEDEDEEGEEEEDDEEEGEQNE